MEEMARTRYVRNSNSLRRRKKSHKVDTTTIAEKIIFQIIICLAILVVVGLVKSIDSPVTNYLSDRFKAVILKDANTENIYSGIRGVFGKLGIGNRDKEDDAVPADADLTDIDEFDEDDTIVGDDYENDRPGQEDSGDTVGVKGGVASEEVAKAVQENYEFLMPVDGVIVSGFGETYNGDELQKFHTGIDIEAENGSPVKSSMEGQVTKVGVSPDYGKYVEIDHGEGISTKYAHCWHILVKEGQLVEAGEVIAEVGNSSVNVGSHLHFEILKDGRYLDPAELLKVQFGENGSDF